jgi:hypothetical protein
MKKWFDLYTNLHQTLGKIVFILMGMQYVLHQGEIGCFVVINVVIWESINFLQCLVFLCQIVHWVVVKVVTFIDSCLLFNVTHIQASLDYVVPYIPNFGFYLIVFNQMPITKQIVFHPKLGPL